MRYGFAGTVIDAEIERRGDDVAGIGVHIASRIADVADPGSVWVSRTVTWWRVAAWPSNRVASTSSAVCRTRGCSTR